MKDFLNKRIAAFVSLAVLALSYGIIGSYPVYELHHMREWTFDLFIFGVIVIAIAGLAVGAKFTPSLTSAGYAIGFIAGIIIDAAVGIVKKIKSKGDMSGKTADEAGA
ncbi:MAG: hypothetical protein LUI15_02005 [Firmicutes bacterium]|nr:hypothetical protein [Bacillota bacterium]